MRTWMAPAKQRRGLPTFVAGLLTDSRYAVAHIGREFGPQYLTCVEQNHGMQTAGRRAIARRVAEDTDAVAAFKRILRPTETLQDGRAVGDDIPFNGLTATIGLKHKRDCRMRIAPVESLHCAFERACLIQVVGGVRMMREGGHRHECCGTK